MYHQYLKAARHYISLFPNNLLDIVELEDEQNLRQKLIGFQGVLDSEDTSELDILRYIMDHQAYFIIGSILKSNYSFGHHDTFLFPEFMLGTSFKADYLVVGKSSGGYEFVFVEFENPTKNITISDGELGSTFRKGLKQVHDWERWLQSNFMNLKEVFNKYKNSNQSLPECFLTYDSTRIHYVVVAGRREDFNENTYRIKRRHRDTEKITILHYDNLCDSANSVIGKVTY
ncbi:hypothetical protein U732_256 [Clostridium argentinense CDC 2741]|uniref:Shedu protein SduA C-terminal domain-containing protein n=1 Tax=Clostridium argentinense CDC 2741 TaxID=1418104 RepID=A0A0C1R3E7_9CLOT|nr:Shedu anti-phage system protein SduA domain-containing protein [Clostridium argentinense]KIE44971.1 hypothetical protein U732_256 [Clostridium argentinense CDC 2741]NFF39668.1 DUF4263 domain-containing protein [Clostridium argentinense]NFP49668.1 DUF4263 domain-containing protein [Clostridium argentinense]NFP72069.1 DUF4263 domain-containing protein [Clostridium argentinense]NFP76770.1 DUF4263 domain-containing protein [Clostridium argentinense]